jgi:hypothetical protein
MQVRDRDAAPGGRIGVPVQCVPLPPKEQPGDFDRPRFGPGVHNGQQVDGHVRELHARSGSTAPSGSSFGFKTCNTLVEMLHHLGAGHGPASGKVLFAFFHCVQPRLWSSAFAGSRCWHRGCHIAVDIADVGMLLLHGRKIAHFRTNFQDTGFLPRRRRAVQAGCSGFARRPAAAPACLGGPADLRPCVAGCSPSPQARCR